MSVKTDRINNMILEQLSYVLRVEVKNKAMEFVTITSVATTSDLSFAKVYFTTLKDKETALNALNKASGFLRKELTHRVELRHMPELKFVYDDSIAYGKKIEQIIEELH